MISGSVVVEGGKKVPSYSVNIESSANKTGASLRTTHISSTDSNSSFSVDGVADGEVFLSLWVEKGYFVKSLTYKKLDLR